ncbi:hypothetical protein, partial [Nocardia cyriacigeorgica]|uniref:hypothetical protein n=1 Tax=Nocardia cyriacigeorgica TaxID=135487 RepID=UPI0024563214
MRPAARAPRGLRAPGPPPLPPGAPGQRDYRSALYDLGVAMFAQGEEEQACELWSQAAAGGHGA